MKRRSLAWPVFLILAGAYWLLKSTGLIPDTALIGAAALNIAALSILVSDGINKQSFVSSLMLIYISIGIVLTHYFNFPTAPFWAGGMIFLGLLLLCARSSWLPEKHNKPNNTP